MTRLGLWDTIAAIATAPGSAGVGIVRLSGPDALRHRRPAIPGTCPAQLHPGRALPVRPVCRTGRSRRQASRWTTACAWSSALRTATPARMWPSCNRTAARRCFRRCWRLLWRRGRGIARPGEFTRRAYLAGRLDLTQAEAVLNLVNAQSETARRQATLGLSGAISARIAAIGADITRTLSAVQAMLDYPEEGVPEEQRHPPLRRAARELSALIATGRAGQLATQGARLALIGAPNAGKSSLLNALLGYERSIVTPLPGTTRDYLEASLELAGVPITLVDTAGLRDTEDQIEAAGVRQSWALAGAADLVLRLEDGSRAREALPGLAPDSLLVQTKADLPAVWHDPAAIRVSAVTGEGLPVLRERVRAALLGDAGRQEVWLGSQRQQDAARRALEHVQAAQGLPDDLASIELEEALHALSEISGRDVQEDVIDAVFRNFCVGK